MDSFYTEALLILLGRIADSLEQIARNTHTQGNNGIRI